MSEYEMFSAFACWSCWIDLCSKQSWWRFVQYEQVLFEGISIKMGEPLEYYEEIDSHVIRQCAVLTLLKTLRRIVIELGGVLN